MSDPGPADGFTIRRHAARPHRVRGQHRASWAAELASLIDGTQRRYTAVVGSAVAASSLVAMAGAASLPSGEPGSAASEAVAEIASAADQRSAPEDVEQAGAAAADSATAPETVSDPVPPGDTGDVQAPPLAPQPAQVSWAPMLDDIDITSQFGQRWGRDHNGIDFAAATGTAIYAGYPGTVTTAGWETGFGNLVVIDHGDGVETYYAHNSELMVAPGQQVEAGEHIADAGNTGFSLGPHLHFEVHVDGEPVEPIDYLESAGLHLR